MRTRSSQSVQSSSARRATQRGRPSRHAYASRSRSTSQYSFAQRGLDWVRSGKWRKIVLTGMAVVLGIYLIWVYMAVATQLPVITNETLENGNFSQTSIVSDRNGTPLYRFYEQNREFISFDQIAPQAINAFVAIEDQSFWQN